MENEYKFIEKPSFFRIDNFDASTFIYSWKVFNVQNKILEKPELWASHDWVFSVEKHGYYIDYMNQAKSFDDPKEKEIRNKFIDSIEFLENK